MIRRAQLNGTIEELKSNIPGRSRVDRFMQPVETASRSSLRTLAVPLDGSRFAEHALPYALAIARRSGATVRLIHVHSVLELMKDPWRPCYSDRYYERLDQDAQHYLSDVLRRIKRVNSVRVVSILDRSNDVVASILRRASTADMVVLATRGRSRFGRFWNGSVSESLMRRQNRPMLFVRGYDSPVHFTADPITQHILIPLGGSRRSEEILIPAATIGRLSRPRLTLLNVRQHALSTIVDHAKDRDVMNYLARIAEDVRYHFTDISSHLVSHTDGIARCILQHANEHDVDLIALAMRPRSRIQRFFRRSVVESVLERAKVPVLLYGPERDQAFAISR